MKALSEKFERGAVFIASLLWALPVLFRRVNGWFLLALLVLVLLWALIGLFVGLAITFFYEG